MVTFVSCQQKRLIFINVNLNLYILKCMMKYTNKGVTFLYHCIVVNYSVDKTNNSQEKNAIKV